MLFSRTTTIHILSPISSGHLLRSYHVVPPSPTTRSLHHRVNNHEDFTTLYTRVLSNQSYRSPSHPPSRLSPFPRRYLFILHSPRPRATFRFSPFYHPPLPASRMLVSTERLSSAWRHTPMKWNPLPWFVGALLLVLIQYRRHRSEQEVHVDEDGHEVIKLKGPWQVGSARVIPPHSQSFYC